MKQMELFGQGVDALKALNNAVVTSRLYPPDAPQVANAIELGYKKIRQFIRSHGGLLLAWKGDDCTVAGVPLDGEVLASFPNLVIYRQLKFLEQPNLLLLPEMDRFAFGQLVNVFTATQERIRREGGGQEFITSLGLTGYFPDKLSGIVPTPATEAPQQKTLVKVRPDLLACLYGLEKRPSQVKMLSDQLSNPKVAVEILAASIAHCLQEIKKKRTYGASPLFTAILDNAGRLMPPAQAGEVANSLGRLLAESMKAPTLVVLCCQNYPDGFGRGVYDGLVGGLTAESLPAVMVIFREKIARERQNSPDESPQVQELGKAMYRLMNTPRGRQLLGSEKAKSILLEGEKQRRDKRLETGLSALLNGNMMVLRSEELLTYLPKILAQLFGQGEKEKAAIIVTALLTDLEKARGAFSGAQRRCLLNIASQEQIVSQSGFAPQISMLLVEMVKKAGTVDDSLESALVFLQQRMLAHWEEGEVSEGDRLLNFFHQLRAGKVVVPADVRQLAGKVQDRGIKRSTLPKLLGQCLEQPKNETLSRRLVMQGPIAIRFLVESLITAEESGDRVKIVDMLSYAEGLPAILRERLPAHMPWYGKRNLIKLIGETGGEGDAPQLLPFFRHDDHRVQREAFLSLYKISGRYRKRLLLEALEDSSELIKGQIIAGLEHCCDQEVAERLSEILNEFNQFSEKNREPIILQLVETLGRCYTPAAMKGLTVFIQYRNQRIGRKLSKQVWEAAERAIGQLEEDQLEKKKKHLQASQLRKSALKQAARVKGGGISRASITGLQQEANIKRMLEKGAKDQAVQEILVLIEKVARTGNKIQAEKLRNWLIDLEPTGLHRLIDTREIIERGRPEATMESHLEVWGELYDALSTEEFEALFGRLVHKNYGSEESIIRQGESQTALFFINSGQVKLHYRGDKGEKLIRNMGPGEIFGAETFFGASVWTMSVTALTSCDLSVLWLERMFRTDHEYPGLENKLKGFCQRFSLASDFERQRGLERREYERYKLSCRVPARLLDVREQTLGVSATVTMMDLSRGGLCYLETLVDKDNRRLYLGRKVQLTLPASNVQGEKQVLVGEILAVRPVNVAEVTYSVHVRFDTLLSQEQVANMIESSKVVS